MTKKELQERESKKRREQITKQKAKHDQNLQKRIQGIHSEYESLFQKQMEKQLAIYERKRQRRINAVTKQYHEKLTDKTKAIRKLEVKVRISTKIRSKAIVEFQKRCKLSRTNSKWQVFLVDKWYRVHRSESVAWHRWPKGRYPHMIFCIDNVRPITEWTNYQQLDNLGFIRQEQFIKQIWQSRFEELDKMAIDKATKNELSTPMFYQTTYDTFKSLNKERQKKLWKYYKNTLAL